VQEIADLRFQISDQRLQVETRRLNLKSKITNPKFPEPSTTQKDPFRFPECRADDRKRQAMRVGIQQYRWRTPPRLIL